MPIQHDDEPDANSETGNRNLLNKFISLDVPDFEWDKDKRLANITKHGIDFVESVSIFFEPHLDEPLSYPHEVRRKALGPIGDRLVAVIYTMRGTSIRIISARRARANEQRAYRALHPRGDP